MKEKNDLSLRLNPVDAQIAAYKANGLSSRQIAPILGVADTTVCNHARKPHVKALIERLAAELADKTAATIVDSHVLAIQTAHKTWTNIHQQKDPSDAAKLATEAKDLLQLSDAKEKRIGQSMGLFPSPAPSVLIQNLFAGPANVVLGQQVAGMIGAVNRELPEDDQQGDIVDLDIL